MPKRSALSEKTPRALRLRCKMAKDQKASDGRLVSLCDLWVSLLNAVLPGAVSEPRPSNAADYDGRSPDSTFFRRVRLPFSDAQTRPSIVYISWGVIKLWRICEGKALSLVLVQISCY